ncbi:unnamed protein product, partial [Closterium sp. NIES-53]
SGVAIFDLDFDVIFSAMYALYVSAEGDCYRCVPPDPGIAASALGASESGTLLGTVPAEALHTFTLDSGASRCFFRDSTTLTTLSAPVPVRLADPSGGPVVAHSSTVLPCLAVPCGSLYGLHLPSFSTNLVSTAALQDVMVTTTTPGGQHVSICTCTRTGRHLATFTCLNTMAAESPQTLLWHHCLGHPSLPCLQGMHSRLLVCGLPRSLPPLPPLPAPPCLPCIEGRQRAAPHSSSCPPTIAPPQTLHMDMWGPARVSGQGRERYFLLVVDYNTRYTTVFPLHSKVPCGPPVLRLHSDRGGEFSSDHLRDFCRGEGILQSFTLLESPQQNGIAKRRIGLFMEVARTSMIHATAPHFLWPRSGKVGDASVFRVWGSRAFVRDMSADKLSARAIPYVFLGFVPDAPGWQFYHLTSRRVLPSEDVTFDESVPFYRLFPYRSAPLPLPPLFLALGPPPVDPLLPQGPAPSGVSQVDPPPGAVPGEVAVDSGAAKSTASGGAEPGGAKPKGAETWGAEPEGVEPGGAESEGAESGGAEPQGAASSTGPAGASPRLSPQQLREWLVRCAHLWSGATAAGGVGVAGAGGAGVTSGAELRGLVVFGALDLETLRSVEMLELEGLALVALELEALELEALAREAPELEPLFHPASPLPAPSPYTEQTGGLTERREPASRPASPVHTARRVPCLLRPPVLGTQTMTLRPSFVPLRVPLRAPPESCLPAVRDPQSDQVHGASLTVSRLLATAVIDPSFESTTASALVAELLDFAAACRLDYTTALIALSASASPPSVGGECALGTDVLEDRQEDFECLAAAVPRFASMLLAPEGDPDAPDIPTPRSYAEVITVPPSGANIVDGMWIFRVKRPPGSPPAFKARYVARGFSQRHGVDYFQTFSLTSKMTTLRVLLMVAAQRDYELHSLDFSTAFLQGSLHEEIWLRRPPGFTGSFPAGTQWSLRRPVYGLRQAPREWHDTLRTTLAALGFAPSTAEPSLCLRTDNSPPLFYVLVYVDDLVFATADTETLTLVKSELQKRHICTDLGSSALRLLVLLATAHSSFYQPLALSSTLGRVRMGLVLGGWDPIVLTGHADASWVDDSAMQRSSQGYTFSLGSGSFSWRSTRSSSVLSSSCEAEIYAGAMAAQELRWLTYLLTNLGEQPRSPPVLYVDNKAMIALCQEHRLEHRTKHIALRYFLARELQQRVQLRLAYVATRANNADIFTKALPPVLYTAHQLNLWPCDARPRVTPVFLWTSSPGVAVDFRVWGCLAPVRSPSANKWSSRTRACVFLGFPWDASGWVFYDLVTYEIFASQDVTLDESVCYYKSRLHRGTEVFSPPLFLTLEPPLVARVAPPPLCPAPSCAIAEGEGAGAAGACGVGSGGAGGVGVEVTPVEDTAASTRWPRPASAPGFPSVLQFPPCSSLQPVAMEPRGVPTGGTGGTGVVSGGGAGSGGAGAGGTSTMVPTPHTIRFLTREQCLLRFEREEHERGGVMSGAASAVAVTAGESREGVSAAVGEGRAGVPPAVAGAVADTAGESRGGVTAATGEGSAGVPVPSQRTLGEAEQQRLRHLPDAAPARLVRGPLPSPPIPPVRSLSSSPWNRRSPLSRAVSPEPRRSRYRADGPFHLVLPSCVPPPPILPQPLESSLAVFHDPLSDYLCAPRLFVSALVTTIAGFASSHRLEYAAHLVRGPACSLSSGGAPVFPLEVLEDRQLELGFLAAAAPHLCAMLLALEGDPDALDIPIPRTHVEAVSGPWASFWIAAEEAEMASYRSTGTYVDVVPLPGANVVSGMWLYKRDYEFHSFDLSTKFLQGSVHEQIWQCRPPGLDSLVSYNATLAYRSPGIGQLAPLR